MRLTKWSTTQESGRSSRPGPRLPARLPGRLTGRPLLSGAFGALALSLALVGCGRSAPESIGEVLPAEGEPEAAGVQVVSQQAVVVPPPTTATVPTTVAETIPPAATGTTYVVQAGDTLSVIAEQFSVTTDAISQANGITDVNSIQPGQELIIPAPG